MFKNLVIDRKKFLEILYAGALGATALFLRHKPFWIQAVVDWLQSGLIFILFIIAARDERRYGGGDTRSDKAVAQFLCYWKNLWRVWLALYLIFAVHNTFKAVHDGPINVPYWVTGLNLVANVANNFQSFCILILFLVMTKKTTEAKNNPIQFTSQLVITTILVFGFLELVFSVLGPVILDFVKDQNGHDLSKAAGIIFSTCSGLFAGVVFCLFFGRLGSHYIRLNAGWMAVLYIYATIQPLYPLFRILDTYSQEAKEAFEVIQTLLKVFAAVLKLTLFFRVREIVRNGRLLFFMKKTAEDDELLDKQFKEFREKLPRTASATVLSEPLNRFEKTLIDAESIGDQTAKESKN
jgi:hypothetical protein